MPANEIRYRVCAPRVIHETLDDETVIVNLNAGSYYSLDRAGRIAWQALADGATLDETIAYLTASYTGDPPIIAAETRRLLGELLAEGLMEPAGGAGVPLLKVTESTRPTFVPPVLGKFTDMQELLLLDPVHDVDTGAGWPHAKTTA